MKFIWDADKAKINEEKHGVTFEYAASIFLDISREDFQDTRINYREERRIVRGLIEQRAYVVIYTMRGNLIRLISARKANERETKQINSIRIK